MDNQIVVGATVHSYTELLNQAKMISETKPQEFVFCLFLCVFVGFGFFILTSNKLVGLWMGEVAWYLFQPYPCLYMGRGQNKIKKEV